MTDETRAAPPTVVFVAHAASNDIIAFDLDQAGALTILQRLQLAQGVGPLTVSPDRRFLYAGLRGERPGIATLSIDSGSGQLQIVSTTPTNSTPVYLKTDTSGQYILSASYADNVFAIYAIDDGVVRTPPVQVTPTPPHAHAICTDPANRTLLVTALGGDVILQYAFDATTGRAVPGAVPFVATRTGSGPRHLVFHPRGNVVYVNGELDGSIGVYRFDASAGRLTARQHVSCMPDGTTAAAWAADLAVTPDGRFVFASERRTDSIVGLRVSDDLGRLERIEILPTEAQPRAIAIDPLGRFLFVAGERSRHVTSYAIDWDCGTLRVLARYGVGEKPVWICATARPEAARSALEEPEAKSRER